MFIKSFRSSNLLLLCFLSFVLFLVSCNNFADASFLKNQIEEKIKVENAEKVQVLILADSQTGTTVPSGNEVVKVGYPFELKFSENPAYSFVKWVSVNTSDGTITDQVVFDEPGNPNTSATFSSSVSNVKIYPLCIERIAVAGEPSPKWEPNGVGRDRSITVEFNKVPSISSFIFTPKEIPSNAEELKDADGRIYAYVLNYQTYFKNISITDENGISLAEHFMQPHLNNSNLKRLEIEINKANPITLDKDSNEKNKTIFVSLKGNIRDETGVLMNSERNWNYRVSDATDEKARINISASNSKEGNVVLGGGEREYSIDQEISFKFEEDDNYQFVRWEYDPEIVSLENNKKIETKAWVIKKTDENYTSKITAVCVERLRVTGFSPSTTEKESVEKDSSIIITFNKTLSTEPADLNQFNNIVISVGGVRVNNSFEAPKIVENKLIFSALKDKSKMLQVDEDNIKTVSVSIPSDLYYKLDDGTKITYGNGNIQSAPFEYNINHNTITKAEVSFSIPENKGSIFVSGEKLNVENTVKYSIGQEIPLKFEVSDDYIFNGWILTSLEENTESKIKISDKSNQNTKLLINEAIPAVLSVDCSEKLKVSSSFITDSVHEKDSDIVLSFNKDLDESCKSKLDEINISFEGGSNVDSCFSERILSGNTIILKNTGLLDVSGSEEKKVTVSVPPVFFYVDRTNEIKLDKSYSFRYKVNSKTIAQAQISFKVIDAENDDVLVSAGSLNYSSFESFDIGQAINLSLDIDSKYQFYGWDISENVSSSEIKILSPNQLSTGVNLNSKCEDVTIKALVYKRPYVFEKSPSSTDGLKEFEKDYPISIHFGHKIDERTIKDVQLSYTGGNISKDFYYETVLNPEQTVLSLIPKKMLPVENNSEVITVTIPHEKIYYLANDKLTKIFMTEDEDYSWSFRINNKTTDNATIRFIVDSTSNPLTTGYKVNSAQLSTGAKETYSLEQKLELNYPLTAGYRFDGWKFETALSGYSIEPSGYTTEGSVTIKNGDKVCLSLLINEDDPTKATIEVLGGINNGIEEYGVTVSAKDTLLPIITDHSPKYSTVGEYCDTPIRITFNKAIDKSTVTLGETGSIQIVNESNDLDHYENYYYPPEFEGNTLTIKPKYTIKSLVPNTDSILKLNIIVSPEIKDKEGLSLKVEDLNLNYRLNGNHEKDGPEITSLQVYKPLYIDGVLDNSKYVTLYSEGRDIVAPSTSNFNKYSSFVSQNHINKEIYFNISASDGSGVKNIKIREWFLRYSASTSDLSVPLLSNEVTYSPLSLSGLKSYQLKSESDGLVRIDFVATDNFDNETVKSYFVHKDTSLDPSIIIPGPAGSYPSVTAASIIAYDTSRATGKGSTYYKFNDNSTFEDSLKFKFEGNVKDVYYSASSSNQKISEIYSIAKWGYSSTTIFNDFEFDSNTRTYILKNSDRDDLTKDVYVKFSVKDEVGNQGEIIRCIPGKCSIVKGNGNDQGTSFSSGYYSDQKNWSVQLDVSGYTEKNATLTSIGAQRFDYQLLYRFKAPGESEFSSDYRSDLRRLYMGDSGDRKFMLYNWTNYYFKPTTYRPEGTYELYLLPYYEYPERCYWGTLSDPLVFEYTNSGGPQVSSSISMSLGANFPTELEVSVSEPEKNSGFHKIKVTHDFERTPGYNYFIYYKTSTSVNSFVLMSTGTSTEFNLLSGKVYSLGVYAIDSSGKYKQTSTLASCDCTTDNIPPDTFNIYPETLFKYVGQPNGFFLRKATGKGGYVWPHDNEGLYKNDVDLVELSYYLIKNDIKFSSPIPPLQIGLDDLEKYKSLKQTIYYDDTIGEVFVPYGPLEEGIYTLVLHMKDVNGNESVYNGSVYNMLRKSAVSTVSISKIEAFEDDRKSNSLNILQFSGVSNKFISSLDSTEKRWNYALNFASATGSGGASTLYFIENETAKSGDYNNVAFYVEKEDGTVERRTWAGKMNFKTFQKIFYNSGSGYYSYPTFYYPDYYFKKGTTEELICDSKFVSEGNKSFQIFYDNPMFVHTLCYSEDLGDDVGLWESKGYEVCIDFRSDCNSTKDSLQQKSFTYIPDLSNAPDSCEFYMVVAHFADGTTVNTSVKSR